MKNRHGVWVANTPYDLIGWEIVDIYQDGNKFTLEVRKKDTKESRTVQATMDAIPMSILELHNKH